ncbi:MAG: ATP-binding protein [Candidatus Cloacimonetes bacterium]|nr:ATP-binding protein [Candidatus Cloacimonadota bacterium]
MLPENELLIESIPENHSMVMDFVDSQISDCPDDVKDQINIAVDEIYSNIVQYAYHPETGGVKIRITVTDVIILEFEDKGIPYNPLTEETPDINKPIEERPLGGLGVFMVKKLMDSVEYKRVGGKNLLILRKKL